MLAPLSIALGFNSPHLHRYKNIGALLGAFVFLVEMSKQNALLAWGPLKGGVLLRTGAAASRGRERVC